MARIHKRHTLKQLYHQKVLFTQVLSLIHKDSAYRTIQTFLRRKHFNMSLGSIGNLVKKVNKAHATGTPIGKLLDKREYSQHQKTLADVQKQGRLHMPNTDDTTKKIVTKSLQQAKKNSGTNAINIMPAGFHVSNRDVLDRQIDEYNQELMSHDCEKDVRQAGLKAIELEDRYPGEGALSLSAIKQYQLIVNAESQALATIVTSMLPPDKVSEFNKRYNKCFKALMSKINLTPTGKKLYTELDKEGVKLD